MSGERIITAGCGRRVQVRKVREGGFTEEKKQLFLDHLAGSCNVSAAARAAGVSMPTISYHRERDPLFAERFGQALERGYVTIEAMLMERAAGGGVYEPGGDVPDARTMDTDLALNLMRLRRAPPGLKSNLGGCAPRKASLAELEAAILAKLDVLAVRRAAGRRKRSPDAPSKAPAAGRGRPKK